MNYPSHVLGPESMLKKEVSVDDKRLCGLMLNPANSVKTDIYIQVIAIFSLPFLFFAKCISLREHLITKYCTSPIVAEIKQ